MNTAIETTETDEREEIQQHPLWRSLAKRMVENGLDYGHEWDASHFERELKCKRDSNEFAFAMASLRGHVESEAGYYIESLKSGDKYRVPTASEHECVARGFERKLKSYARRSVALRNMTLTNPQAQLTEGERNTMEKGLQIASTRAILIARTKSIGDAVKKYAPALLEKAS